MFISIQHISGLGLASWHPFFLLPPSLFLHGQTLTDRCKARTVALLPSRFARDSPFVHSFARRNGRLFMDFHRSYHHRRTLATPPAPWLFGLTGPQIHLQAPAPSPRKSGSSFARTKNIREPCAPLCVCLLACGERVGILSASKPPGSRPSR